MIRRLNDFVSKLNKEVKKETEETGSLIKRAKELELEELKNYEPN